jgi:hypothetical protein
VLAGFRSYCISLVSLHLTLKRYQRPRNASCSPDSQPSMVSRMTGCRSIHPDQEPTSKVTLFSIAIALFDVYLQCHTTFQMSYCNSGTATSIRFQSITCFRDWAAVAATFRSGHWKDTGSGISTSPLAAKRVLSVISAANKFSIWAQVSSCRAFSSATILETTPSLSVSAL